MTQQQTEKEMDELAQQYRQEDERIQQWTEKEMNERIQQWAEKVMNERT